MSASGGRSRAVLSSGLEERGLGFGVGKGLMDVAEDDTGIERSIDGRVNPLLGIVIHQGRRLSVVRVQSGKAKISLTKSALALNGAL